MPLSKRELNNTDIHEITKNIRMANIIFINSWKLVPKYTSQVDTVREPQDRKVVMPLKLIFVRTQKNIDNFF